MRLNGQFNCLVQLELELVHLIFKFNLSNTFQTIFNNISLPPSFTQFSTQHFHTIFPQNCFTICFTLYCILYTISHILYTESLSSVISTKTRKVRWRVVVGWEENSWIWETLNLSTCEQHSTQTKQLKWQKHRLPVFCSLSHDSYYLDSLGKNWFD